MSLERAIRDAAASGKVSGLTLWPSGGVWQGNVRDRKTDGWVIVYDADPVTALLKALGQFESKANRRDEDLI